MTGRPGDSGDFDLDTPWPDLPDGGLEMWPERRRPSLRRRRKPGPSGADPGSETPDAEVAPAAPQVPAPLDEEDDLLGGDLFRSGAVPVVPSDDTVAEPSARDADIRGPGTDEPEAASDAAPAAAEATKAKGRRRRRKDAEAAEPPRPDAGPISAPVSEDPPPAPPPDEDLPAAEPPEPESPVPASRRKPPRRARRLHPTPEVSVAEPTPAPVASTD